MKGVVKKLIVLMLAMICALGIPAMAGAASFADSGPQEGRKCTVRVAVVDQDEYHESEPVYVDGARLSLVKVASLNTDGSYTLLEAFDGLEGWEDYISGSDSSDETKTARNAMEKAAAGNVPAADTQTTDRDGTATLTADAGEYGIYLLYESGHDEGSNAQEYMDMTPTLLQMPAHKNDQWIYDLAEVNPKIAKGVTVTIRKRGGDADGGATDVAVLGAHLKIVSADKPDQVIDEWDTTDVDHDSVSLEPGNYILEETYAPDGFELAGPVPFEVRSDGKLIIGDAAQSGNEIVMVDPVKTEPDGDADEDADGETSGGRTVVESLIHAVRTGDAAKTALWIALMAAAVCLIVVLVRRRRR